MIHYKPSFMAGVVINGNELYFSDSFINALCIADISTGLCRYIDTFPDEKRESRLLHSGAFKYKNSIIFVPKKGKHIHFVDLISKEIRSVNMNSTIEIDTYYEFSLLSEDELWLFPKQANHHITSYNLITGEVRLHGDFQSKGRISYTENLIYAHEGKKVLVSAIGTSIMMEYDIDIEDLRVLDTGLEKIENIYLWQGDKWICTGNGIYKQIKDSDNYDKYDMEQPIGGLVLFMDAVTNDIFAMSAIGGDVFVLEEKKFVKFTEMDIERSPTYTDGYPYGKYTCIESGIFIFPPYGKDGVMIKDGEMINYKFHTDNEKEMADYIREAVHIYNHDPIYEKGPISIADFITLI